jgi:probable HAF family extracellular repeat protein
MKIFSQRLIALLVLVSFHLFAAAVLAQQQYTVVDLGTLGGETASPFGINNNGQVVGTSSTSGTAQSSRRAFRLNSGVMQNLGTVNGGPVSDGIGINDTGQVVGRTSVNPGDDRSFAFLYSGGVMQNLGALPSDVQSAALSINKSGTIVGVSEHNGSSNIFVYIPFYRGFLYSGGIMQDLSALVGGVPTRANGINDAGQVVGSLNTAASGCGEEHAFFLSGPTMLDLGTLPGKACSSGIAINDFGWVVGVSAASDMSLPRLFLYKGSGLQDLGSLGPERNGRPWDINNAGQIVGSFSINSQNSYAFLYSDGRFTDLNTVIPPGLGWNLQTATGINDSGQIVCIGFRPNSFDSHAFLLTPTAPALITEPNSNKVISLDSVTYLQGPFPFSTEHNFSADKRTRILFFARYAALADGESPAVLTAQAESSNGIHPLTVESIRPVVGHEWLTQIVVRIPDQLINGGDIQLSISLRGITSNKGLVTITPTPGSPSRR